jgi:hypothetical protein
MQQALELLEARNISAFLNSKFPNFDLKNLITKICTDNLFYVLTLQSPAIEWNEKKKAN